MCVCSVLKLARVASGVLADVPASLITTAPEHHVNVPPAPKEPPQNHNLEPTWQPRIPGPDGTVQALDPSPALFIVHQFLKQRGYHRCAGVGMCMCSPIVKHVDRSASVMRGVIDKLSAHMHVKIEAQNLTLM